MVLKTERLRGVWISGLLSVFGAAVAGYHPYAEDGGVYVAGVKKLLRPELYAAWTAFVTEHLRFSLFAPLLAELVRGLHVPLEWVLAGLYLAALWATLLGGWMLAARVTASEAGRVGAVALLACWLTLPITGTSLMLMDPYLTARSLVLPLCLWALAWALEQDRPPARRWTLAGLSLGAAACLHPLMAGYGVAAVLALQAARGGGRAMAAFAGTGAALAGLLQAVAAPESADYLQVEATRYYWFLSQWAWFEWLGIVAPLALLLGLGRRGGRAAELSRAMLLLGGVAGALALVFCRVGLRTHLVARMQPLRCFQMVYVVMIVLLGAWIGEWIGERLGRRRAWLGALAVLCLGGSMGLVQRQIYAHSSHIEWPGAAPENLWEQAFVWVRGHTEEDAVFALDARYITRGPGEDAQCFRALAERSALPDYSKDGGEAAITPALTAAWESGERAQENLQAETDAARIGALRGSGADWVVLEAKSVTAWACPYRNAAVKVCRMPR